MTIAPIDEVSRSRCMLADHGPLAAMRLVAPHAGLVAVQQIGQHLAVGNIGRRGLDCVDQLAAAVDSEMPLHPEGQFFNDFRWLHLQTPLKELSCFNGLGANLQTRLRLVPVRRATLGPKAAARVVPWLRALLPFKRLCRQGQ